MTDRNDALGTHDLRRRKDAAQSNRPVPDDDDRSAACGVRAHDAVMAGRHYVGERQSRRKFARIGVEPG